MRDVVRACMAIAGFSVDDRVERKRSDRRAERNVKLEFVLPDREVSKNRVHLEQDMRTFRGSVSIGRQISGLRKS